MCGSICLMLMSLGNLFSQPVQQYKLNNRYLEYEGNPVILVTSAEHYGALVNLDFDYRQYLETLHREGFNYTRIFTGTYIEPVQNIFGIEKNTLAPLPDRYISPWLKEHGKYDLGKFNPQYFVRLKDFMRQADELGIIIEITLFTSIYANNSWELCPFNAINNSNQVGEMEFKHVNTLYNGGLKKYQELYIRKMVRELNGYDHFFFEIQNEPWADNANLVGYVNREDEKVFTRPWQKKVELANGVAMEWQAWVTSVINEEESKLSKKHLIAQNVSNLQHDLNHLPKGISLINFHYALPDAVISNLDLGGVIGLDETGFMPHEDKLYINQAWRFMLSGGGLYNNLDYSFTAGNETGRWPIPETNPGWGGPEFRQKLSYLVQTMNQVPFHEMEFSDSIVKSSARDTRQYGLQKPGESYLVFLENFGGADLVPMLPVSNYIVTWLNVSSGERIESDMKLGNGMGLSSPFEDEQVVLLIQKTNE